MTAESLESLTHAVVHRTILKHLSLYEDVCDDDDDDVYGDDNTDDDYVGPDIADGPNATNAMHWGLSEG